MIRTSVHQGLIEGAVRDTLQAWLPYQLARVERENNLEVQSLPQPRSWPVASEFDLRVHEQLPAVFIVATGKAGASQRSPKGWRATWPCEVAVAVAAENEATARELAGLMLAAVRTALLWHPTLDGLAEHIEWGPEDLAVGAVERGARCVYGAQFDITIPAAITRRPPEDPSTPPLDPYEPPVPLEPLETADIAVTATDLTGELP